MRFFIYAYQSFKKPDKIISKEDFSSIFDIIDINDMDFSKEKYVPGSSGQGELYRELLEKSELE